MDDFVLSLKTVRGAIEQLLTRVSNEADVEDVDSEFGEGEGEDEDEESMQGSLVPEFPRPRGVRDEDWRVYKVLDGMLHELDVKFRAMWA